MASGEYRVHLARLERLKVGDEIAEVKLTLMHREGMVNLVDGEEFVTVLIPTEVDPWSSS